MLFKGSTQSSKYMLTIPELRFYSVSEYRRMLCTVHQSTLQVVAAHLKSGRVPFCLHKMRNRPRHFRSYFLITLRMLVDIVDVKSKIAFCLCSVPFVIAMQFLQMMRTQCFLTHLEPLCRNAASPWQWHLKSQSSSIHCWKAEPWLSPISKLSKHNLFFSGKFLDCFNKTFIFSYH